VDANLKIRGVKGKNFLRKNFFSFHFAEDWIKNEFNISAVRERAMNGIMARRHSRLVQKSFCKSQSNELLCDNKNHEKR
jgi:hypothetical protein